MAKLFFYFFILTLFFSQNFIEARGGKPACLKELQQNFFDEKLVRQTLALYRMPQGMWKNIIEDLKRNQKAVEKIMQTKAIKMRPNPLRPPFNPEQTEALLKETLYEVFYKTIDFYKITDSDTIRAMFNHIIQQENIYIKNCLNKRNS